LSIFKIKNEFYLYKKIFLRFFIFQKKIIFFIENKIYELGTKDCVNKGDVNCILDKEICRKRLANNMKHNAISNKQAKP